MRRACLVVLAALAAGCGPPSVWKDFRPDTGTAIVGRVVDPKGVAVLSAQVSTGPETDTEFCNDQGYFAIQAKRAAGAKGQASTTSPIPQGQYQLFVDKGLYRPHEAIPVKFSGGVLDLREIVLVPEPIDLDLQGFRPAKSDPTLPADAADPRKE